MTRTGFAIFLLILAAAPGGASGDALEDREWKLITSDNFRVHSLLGVTRTTEMLRQLEVMRVALGGNSGTATFQAAVPTVIIALDNAEDYALIGAPESTVGFFIADQRENAIVVQDNAEVEGVRTILHEYVHYLHRLKERIALPRWFEEGTAEYLSSSRVVDDRFEFGLPLPGRLSSLTFASWLPMREVLTLNELSNLTLVDGDLFYSQAWLLVHYLNSRAGGRQAVMQALQRYRELVVNGEDRIVAFEKTFELAVDDLNETLLEYLLADDFRTQSIRVNSALPGFSPRVQSIPKSQIQIALAQMAIRFENDVAAERWFTAALESDDTRALAEAGLGTVLGFRGDVENASRRFEAAILLVSYDFRMWMDYAQFWAGRIANTYDRETREVYARRLEEALRNALTIADATPELNSLMGFAYLARGKDLDEAIEYLQAAAQQSPADQGSLILLANAYLYSGQPEQAIGAARSVLSLAHDTNPLTISAREIIEKASHELTRRH